MVLHDELKALIASGKGYVLIDVREKHELVHGTIPTSHNIPMSELSQALSSEQFNKKGRMIFYCRTGSRSARATALAKTQGYAAENYAGSVKEWSQHDSNVKMY